LNQLIGIFVQEKQWGCAGVRRASIGNELLVDKMILDELFVHKLIRARDAGGPRVQGNNGGGGKERGGGGGVKFEAWHTWAETC